MLSILALALAVSGCRRGKSPEKFLERANHYYENREFEKAKIEYINTLRRQPTNTIAVLRLGEIFYRQGQFRDALPLLVEGRRSFPTDIEAATDLAAILLAAGNRDAARSNALWIVNRSPTNETALAILLGAATEPKDTRDLINQLDRLQRTFGDRSQFHVVRGMLATRNPDFAAADAELQRAVALDPKSSLVQSSIGLLRWAQGSTNQAEQAFRTAVKLDPTNVDSRLQLAQFLLRAGQNEEAKKLLDEVSHDAPERTGVWTLRAEIALIDKQFDECERLLAYALAQAPGDVDARSLQAQLRLAQNQFGEAVRLLKLLVEGYPNSGTLNFQLGVAEMQNQDLEGAARFLSRATALETNNAVGVLTLADVNLRRGQAALAASELGDLIRRMPGLEGAHLMLGRCYQQMGRPEETIRIDQALRQQWPKDAAIPYQLGLAQLQLRRPEEARKSFEETRTLAPDDFQALEQMVSIDLATNAPARALATLQPELERRPKNAGLWLLRAKIYGAQRNLDGAREAVDKSIAIDPNLPAGYLLLAEFYLQSRRLDDSLQRLDALLGRNPTNLAALSMRGLVLSEKGDYEGAQKAYESALNVNSNAVIVLNNLAYLLSEKRSKPEEALQYGLRARQLVPGSPNLADTLGWIEYRLGHYPDALRLLAEAESKLSGAPEVEAHFGSACYMMAQEADAKKAFTVALKSTNYFPGRDLAEKRLLVLTGPTNQPPGKVISTLEELRQEDPLDLIATLRLGRAYLSAGNLGKAREAFEAALKINPATIEGLTHLATLLIDQDRARAHDLAQQAQILAPEDPDVAQIRGQIAMASGDYPGAYAVLGTSAIQHRDRPRLWFSLSEAAFGVGRLNEATQAMQTALKLGLPLSLTNTAQTFLALVAVGQDPAAAVRVQSQIEGVLSADPGNGPALFADAIALESLGKFAAARDQHESLLRRRPSFIPSIRQLAILYGEHLQDETKAYEFATKARAALPKDDRLALTLGKLSARRGDDRYAVQLFAEAAASRPTDAELQFQLGTSYLRLKQLPAGRAALERAIQLNPQGAFVAEARKMLLPVNAN